MTSLRFLLTRRWVLFAITVALLAALAWRLGEWQFHRLDERRADNAVLERNLDAEPVPVAQVLAPDESVAHEEEWARVTATGRYDPTRTVLVRYQTRDGEPGVDVVVPLVTDDGPALLVDRGWLASDNRGAEVDDVPPPPSGEVTVVGWVRADATGDSTAYAEHGVRAVSSRVLGPALDLEVYGGFVDLDSEEPEAASPLARAELPDRSEGPHFFYGLQWWFFAVLAVFGFFYLTWEELTGRAERRRSGRSEPPEPPPVDREHRAGDEARRG